MTTRLHSKPVWGSTFVAEPGELEAAEREVRQDEHAHDKSMCRYRG